MAKSKIRIYEILEENKQDIIEDWMREQLRAITLRKDLINETDLRKQSEKFLEVFITACRSGNLTDISAIEWVQVRELLASISKSRAVQGFTPSETATFVFSLKQPVFVRIRVDMKSNVNLLTEEIWTATVLLDKLGLFSIEVYLEGREEVLRDSEKFLNSIVEQIPDMIIVKDAQDLRFVRFNKAGEDLLGYSREELLGKNDYDLFPKHEADFFTGIDKDVLLKNQLIVIPDEKIHTRNKGERILYTKKIPIVDERGNPSYLLGISEDITERKQADEEIRKFSEGLERMVVERTADITDINQKLIAEINIRLDAEKQLTKTVVEKEVLLREVHHRVKNNLQIIISLLNLQSRYLTDEATLSAFRESQNRIKAMSLVHEKLYQSADISKIELDKYLMFLGNNLLQFFGMKGKGITLTMDIRDISLAIDTAIPLGLMINEMISNSLKYAFPNRVRGEISIAIHRQDNTLSIVYKDNGVGIPQDFDWKNAKSLGLRLVISLVEQLRGTIKLDRTAGTTFTIVVKEKE
jgi:PAS domain S-box-containing protein